MHGCLDVLWSKQRHKYRENEIPQNKRSHPRLLIGASFRLVLNRFQIVFLRQCGQDTTLMLIAIHAIQNSSS